ncbi:hypothetical protein FPY71_08745 [Aureimonas fodinaquatilis]|uniref:Lipopolysaccharide biosynthesis protein n=1 Tax=Aureimonas fodinaquatilis TaxID=2565783 RepID=A0A5B0DUT9_9HYPH|nr:hypothetical protein [Aureimonas fodinaquatilis]KAA0970577.1 hypothetical protein FPY71_08745 [Aureimonas fodinaquatilis]
MDNEITRNIKYYLELALRRPLYAILPAIAVVLVGLVVIMQLPRSYVAEAIIVVRSDQNANSLVSSTVANERLQFIEQRVLARDKLLDLVNRMDLFPDVRNGLSDTRLAGLVRGHIAIIPLATEESLQYANRSVFNVRFTYGDRELAAAVATELVNMIIQENRDSRTGRAAETSQFLEREVDALTVRLDERDKTWREFLEQNSNALPSRMDALTDELNTREQELTEVGRAIPALDDEIRLLEAEYRYSAPLADTAAAARQRQLDELRTDLANKSSTMADAHPEIRSLQSRIEFLQAQIAEQAAQPASSEAPTLTPELALIAERIELSKPRREALVKQQQDLQERVTWLRDNIARSPEVGAQMAALDRDRASAQRSLEEMRAKLDTARVGLRLEEDQNADQIQVVEAPEVPRYASEPSRSKLFLVLLGLAGVVGAACLYASDFLDRTIRGTFDLTRSLEGQSVVVIPELGRKNKWLSRIGLASPMLALAIASGLAGLPGPSNEHFTTHFSVQHHAMGGDFSWTA